MAISEGCAIICPDSKVPLPRAFGPAGKSARILRTLRGGLQTRQERVMCVEYAMGRLSIARINGEVI